MKSHDLGQVNIVKIFLCERNDISEELLILSIIVSFNRDGGRLSIISLGNRTKQY